MNHQPHSNTLPNSHFPTPEDFFNQQIFFDLINLKLDEVATKGLTQSQIDSLEKNIITFEVTNLNGMNIIVPKIYLSLKTRSALGENSLASNSTIFAKENLTIDSPTNSLGASLLNTGSIISGKDMVMNLASLKNKTEGSVFALRASPDASDSFATAEIKSGNNLAITAFGTEGIKNLGAKIITNYELRVCAGIFSTLHLFKPMMPTF